MEVSPFLSGLTLSGRCLHAWRHVAQEHVLCTHACTYPAWCMHMLVLVHLSFHLAKMVAGWCKIDTSKVTIVP